MLSTAEPVQQHCGQKSRRDPLTIFLLDENHGWPSTLRNEEEPVQSSPVHRELHGIGTVTKLYRSTAVRFVVPPNTIAAMGEAASAASLGASYG